MSVQASPTLFMAAAAVAARSDVVTFKCVARLYVRTDYGG